MCISFALGNRSSLALLGNKQLRYAIFCRYAPLFLLFFCFCLFFLISNDFIDIKEYANKLICILDDIGKIALPLHLISTNYGSLE